MAKDFSNVGKRDPDIGDHLRVEEEDYRVADRCPCGPEAMHIRWFLESDDEINDIRFAQEGVLAKEWDESGDEAWWFGRRIGAADLRTGKQRLTERLRRSRKRAPKQLSYEGRHYRLAGVTDPPRKKARGKEDLPMSVWEYVDAKETESVLIESSPDGEVIAYHGWYANPEDIRIA